MNKYEDLERLQKLKEAGSISDQEFENEKNKILNKGMNKKKKNILAIIISLVIIVVIIGGIQIIVNIANKGSAEHGEYVAQKTLSDKSGSSNKYKNEIINKWNATLPLNNTNGLESAVYNINAEELYLKYNMGICVVDKDNKINRYVEGDLMNGTIKVMINNAKNGNSEYVYMTAEEFEDLIN